jgi:hypothetical protein
VQDLGNVQAVNRYALGFGHLNAFIGWPSRPATCLGYVNGCSR